MDGTGEFQVTIYQSNAERHRDSQTVSEYREMFESISSKGPIETISVEDISGVVRDADEDEMYADRQRTKLANEYERWESGYGADVELLFFERGAEYNEPTNETHHRIWFDTPFVELRENGTLRGVFPSRVGGSVVHPPLLVEILQGEESWHELELDIQDHRQSGSEEHDAWRGNFIERSGELLGEEWELTESLELEVAAPEFDGLAGAVDLVYSRGPTEYYLIDIKPVANQDKFDRGIGQLYRYAELFSRQERITAAGDIEINLALASPSIPEGLQAVARRAGVEPIEIYS